MVQSALMLLVLLASELIRAYPGGVAGFMTRLVGGLLFGWGTVVGVWGALVLGRNRTIFPAPARESELIRHGVYRWLRHPLYSSLMGLALGWSLLRGSWAGATASVLLIAFLRLKAGHEERLLRERFADYPAYARATRRFVPGVW